MVRQVHAAKVMKAMTHRFESDQRTAEQCAADLDSPRVTVSMYAVDDQNGMRKEGSVFRAGKPDWEPAVSGTYRQFTAETGFDNLGMPSFQEAGDVWLVADTGTLGSGYIRVAGAAEVCPKGNGGELRWVWMHPLRRGSERSLAHRGFEPSLTQHLVNRLLEEYGTIVPSPEKNTPAGRRFLESYFQISVEDRLGTEE